MSSLPRQQVFIGKHLQGGFCLSLSRSDSCEFWWVLWCYVDVLVSFVGYDVNPSKIIPSSPCCFFILVTIGAEFWWRVLGSSETSTSLKNRYQHQVPTPLGEPLEVIRRPQELEHVGGLNVQGWKLSSATVDGNLVIKKTSPWRIHGIGILTYMNGWCLG